MVTAVSNNAQSAATQTASQSLANNYSTFLTLLTAQLKNQDPLNPTDSNQFVQQLVSFSGVEQQIRASDQLEKLVALQQGATTGTAVSYLGKTVTLDSPTTALGKDGAQWNYALNAAAGATKITIKDSTGKTVYTANGEIGAGPHTFSWDGKTSAGDAAPAGNYTLSVESKDASGEEVPTFVSVKGVVKAVDLSTGTPMVETDAGIYLLESVLRVDA
jgi:flagellar basal-body rod modification protein FlgD